MKLLKIMSLGLAVWGVMLLWPEVNYLLTLPVMIGLVVGLVAVSLAYLLGQRFGQPEGNGNWRQPLPSQPVKPATAGRRHRSHSRPTLPLKVSPVRQLHSHPTRPMSGTFTR